ncbi:IQ domain-containing protein K-like [Acanthaster planci]|uniref:IQ domain-containing protein K-like n=1 Tax=Acanthaster planci TaxID=133434 RepID=A0A8B7YQJ6_ACAPL|nr:IQ domain-containing protein K-like [Acanthaster planci]
MSIIGQKPEVKLWDEICKEFALMRPPFPKDDDQGSVTTDITEFRPEAHSPVMFGHMAERVEVDSLAADDFDPASSHPACIGYTMLERQAKRDTPPPPTPPPRETCMPREYLEHYIFPVLLPALLAMLKQAKKEKCFERKRFRFNGCDYLTEYLWRHNPKYTGRESDQLEDIPFVKRILADHPRPPLPLSLIWTEHEAAVVIQSFYRGFKVRKEEHIQELRQWQREWRDENADIKVKVEDFWKEHEPGSERGSAKKVRDHKSHSARYPACYRLRTWSPSPERS